MQLMTRQKTPDGSSIGPLWLQTHPKLRSCDVHDSLSALAIVGSGCLAGPKAEWLHFEMCTHHCCLELLTAEDHAGH